MPEERETSSTPISPGSASERVITSLLVESGGETREVSVEAERITIGREPASAEGSQHISLPQDDTVSRRHAELIVRADWACIIDLDSTNGTRLNGTALAPNMEVVVHEGDVLSIGEGTRMELRR